MRDDKKINEAPAATPHQHAAVVEKGLNGNGGVRDMAEAGKEAEEAVGGRSGTHAVMLVAVAAAAVLAFSLYSVTSAGKGTAQEAAGQAPLGIGLAGFLGASMLWAYVKRTKKKLGRTALRRNELWASGPTGNDRAGNGFWKE